MAIRTILGVTDRSWFSYRSVQGKFAVRVSSCTGVYRADMDNQAADVAQPPSAVAPEGGFADPYLFDIPLVLCQPCFKG